MRKRLYPARIKVRNRWVRVELVPFIEEKGRVVTRGYFCPKRHTITLLSTLSDKELFSTFIHELLHAIEHYYRVRIPHKLVYAQEGPISETLLRNFHLLPRR